MCHVWSLASWNATNKLQTKVGNGDVVMKIKDLYFLCSKLEFYIILCGELFIIIVAEYFTTKSI